MRSSGLKGNAVGNSIDGPVENGLSQKEEGEEAQRVAAKVVEKVVQLASEEADQRQRNSPRHNRGCDLPRLPTIQIDTVPSPPWSPAELSPITDDEPPIDAGEIDIQLQDQDQQPQQATHPDSDSEELRESLRSFVEDLLSQAMGVVEKKLQFVGIDDDDEEEEEAEEEAGGAAEEEVEERIEEQDEEEIRKAAEKVVEEVLSKATETVTEKMEKENPDLEFPISFEDAPEDVKDVASNLVKEIVGKAITMAEEKAAPTVPFNFEDVDLIKTSGPWYVRVREALLRVLRSACFCTPRRDDS